MSDLTESEVRAGLPVEHKSLPEKGLGLLTGQTMDSVVLMVEVMWGGSRREFEPLHALSGVATETDNSFESLARQGRYGQIEELRSLMTFEKLQGDLSNVMYSMQTAEIDFFAHQFVPVLKFVNSPLSRLLIADEVGLGKTIEAGLIWTECRARFKSRRLLIICPPTLVPKWMRELENRFGIECESADAALLFNHFERFQRKPESHSFALVTSYHAVRPFRKERDALAPWLGSDSPARDSGNTDGWGERPKLLRSLLEWNEREPFADLLVFDEAHLMKNTASASRLAGKIFSEAAQSVLALTATPLTTKNRDLFSLLNLVDPDMFEEESMFNQLRERNRPAVLLANELGRSIIDPEKCRSLLEEVPDSAAKRNLAEDLKTLNGCVEIDVDQRVELRGKASRLNELGAFMTRTRKIEVIQSKVVREAVTLTVEPSKEELALYNGMFALIRKKVAERGDMLSLFHLIGPALLMTSCLPMMAQRLRDGSKWGDLTEIDDLQGAYLGDGDDDKDDAQFVSEDASAFFSSGIPLGMYDFEAQDSKFKALRDQLLTTAPGEKVIIFAFYKGTLNYLMRRLEEEGLSCLLVTGDVTDRKVRDELLRSFEGPRYRVLLCSEVAAEGVDLQFCRVMVNYDLPWNPMRVEQRIGRIDRIGQKAESIAIINFHVEGTIDGSIYRHLYSNVGIFTETVGDLEGIIGDRVKRLTLELLSNELSPELAEEKIKATASAIAMDRKLTAEISSESESLLGLRSYFQESVEQAQTLGRYIKPSEIRRFTDEFFQHHYTGTEACQLNWDTPEIDCLNIQLSFRALSDFEHFLGVHNLPRPAGFSWDNRSAAIVFDPSRHELLKQRLRSLTLVNHIHPFVVWMVHSSRGRSRSWHPAAAVRLATDLAPPGIYLFMIARFSIKHPSLSREELLFRVGDVSSGAVLGRETSEAVVNDALLRGRSWASVDGFPNHEPVLRALLDGCSRDSKSIGQSFVEELELRVNSRRSQIEHHFNRRIEVAKKRLAAMEQVRDSREKGIALTEKQIGSLESRLAEELSKLDSTEAPVPKFKRLAFGLVELTTSTTL